MKNETKQTLISLSLAGAIGYYLYNKLVKAGGGAASTVDASVSAANRTAEELSWRPAPIVEEPPISELMQEEPVAEEVAPYAVSDVPVEEEPVVEEVSPDVFDDVVPAEPEVVEDVQPEPDFVMPVLTDEESKVAPVEELEQESVVEDVEEQVEPIVEEVIETPILHDEFVAPVIENMPVNNEVENDKTICPNCGYENENGCRFCNECGTKLETAPVEQLVEPVTEEPPLITPTLDFGDSKIQLPNLNPVEDIKPVEEIQPEPVLESEEDVSMDDLDDEEDTSVDDLFNAVNEAEQPKEEVEPASVEEPKRVMENTEQLHKVDQKDESSRKEFKSIMDFFAANGLA